MEASERLSRAESLNVGGPVTDSTADLCLNSRDIDIRAISRLLGCEPTEAHQRGEVIGQRGPAPIGLWSLEAPVDLSFSDKLRYLVQTTTSDRRTWDALVVTHSIKLGCAVFLHSWTEDFDIPAELLSEIGSRHWHLELSLYSAEGEEILDAFLSKPSDKNLDDD